MRNQSHPSGRTKGDLLRFYDRISAHVIPHLRDRPMVMTRLPDGIGGARLDLRMLAE